MSIQNPHSPTDSWLQAIVDDNGYDSNPAVGDVGTHVCHRESGSYEITIERIE